MLVNGSTPQQRFQFWFQVWYSRQEEFSAIVPMSPVACSVTDTLWAVLPWPNLFPVPTQRWGGCSPFALPAGRPRRSWRGWRTRAGQPPGGPARAAGAAPPRTPRCAGRCVLVFAGHVTVPPCRRWQWHSLLLINFLSSPSLVQFRESVTYTIILINSAGWFSFLPLFIGFFVYLTHFFS